MFTLPVFSEDRESFHFFLCLDPTSLSSGSYSGIVTVSGPDGLGHAAIQVTVNKKTSAFYWQALLVLLVSVVFLVYKEMTNTDRLSFSEWKVKQAAGPNLPVSAYMTDKSARWGVGFLLIEFAVPLAIAFGAMYGVYSNDPAWGADTLGAWISLFGTAFAAAGLRSLIVAGRQ